LGQSAHFTQQDVRAWSGLAKRQFSRWQEPAQWLPQCMVRRTSEQRGCRRIEDRDEVLRVDTQNGVERGIDYGSQPGSALPQFLVAFPQCLGAGLQGLALGQQRPLINHGADEAVVLRLAIVDAGNVHVTAQDPIGTGQEPQFIELAGA